MNRDEILEKSRIDNANGDEREKMINSKGEKITTHAVYITAIIVILLNQYFGREQNTALVIIDDLLMILFMGALCRDAYKFFKDKTKSHFYEMLFDLAFVIWHIIDFVKTIL